jgi:tol-pal system protein YbgF
MGARGTWLLAAALLAGCQEFGGILGGSEAPQSPREQRLASIEAKLAEVTRKLDNLSLAAQAQNLARLEAEVRGLRGEVEKLRFDFDTSEVRARDLYQDLDKRLARIENQGGARLSMEPRLSQAPAGAASQDEEATYSAVFEQLKAGKFDDSIKGFRSLLNRWPQGRYADNAWYWLGESYYAKKSLDSAADSFRTLLTQFPDSAKAPDALFKVGVCQYDKKQRNEARATWLKVVSEYPTSSAAGLARQRLEQTK